MVPETSNCSVSVCGFLVHWGYVGTCGTHIMQWEGRWEHTLLYQSVYPNFTLFLLAKHSGRQNLIQNAASLHTGEVILPVITAQEPVCHVQLVTVCLSYTGTGGKQKWTKDLLPGSFRLKISNFSTFSTVDEEYLKTLTRRADFLIRIFEKNN